MIQTDAPIAPGSSGGALLDDGGAVIGITTAIAVSDVGAEGLGFAVPIDIARSVADQLIKTGKVTNVWLGVEGNDLDGATANDLDVDGGALIGRVKAGSPAEQAGLTPRDVVVAVDGKPVGSMGALVVALRSHRPGDRVTLHVLRDGKRQEMPVTLAERPPE
jgi:S1-C subfamily serine protease